MIERIQCQQILLNYFKLFCDTQHIVLDLLEMYICCGQDTIKEGFYIKLY